MHPFLHYNDADSLRVDPIFKTVCRQLQRVVQTVVIHRAQERPAQFGVTLRNGKR